MPGPRKVSEIFDELFAIEDQSEVTSVLANSDNPTIKAFRSKQFSVGEKEGGKKLKALTTALAGAESVDDVLKAVEPLGVAPEVMEKVKSTVPDIKATEAVWQGKVQAEKDKAKAAVDKLKASVVALGKKGVLNQFNQFLSAQGDDLLAILKRFPGKKLELGMVFPQYAEKLVAPEYADRIVLDDDGNWVDVLKPGENTPYEGGTPEEKLAMLAADARKKISPEWIRASAGSGAGMRGSDNGVPGSQPGPVVDNKRTKEAGDYAL